MPPRTPYEAISIIASEAIPTGSFRVDDEYQGAANPSRREARNFTKF
jgi:hypothetical protein